jgi:hypothetical protein
MSFYPHNPLMGQQLQSDVPGVNVDESFLAHVQFSAANAVVSAVAGVHAAVTDNGAIQTITTGITQPGTPKNITATTDGTAADIKAVQVIIHGTNYLDEVISETLPVFTENTKTTVLGNKAFKTVTSFVLPIMDGTGATVSIGFGEKLGLPYKLSHNTVQKAFLNNALEGTAPTVTVSATEICNNTVDLNSALDGHVVDVYLFV